MVSPRRDGFLVLEDGLGRDLDALEVEQGSRVDDKLAQRALDGQLLKPSAQLLLQRTRKQKLEIKFKKTPHKLIDWRPAEVSNQKPRPRARESELRESNFSSSNQF